MTNQKPPLKVGFDLDGVLLYNPARIFRPITVAIKQLFPKTEQSHTQFYYPDSLWEQTIWRIVHWSSLFVAEGFDDLTRLSKEKKILPYIITSRYDCLRDDFFRWVKRLNKDNIFIDTFHNKKNLQPHEFKINKIRELGLDLFVEDNWNIVEAIARNTKATPLWITNALDKNIVYTHKYANLKEAVAAIRKLQ